MVRLFCAATLTFVAAASLDVSAQLSRPLAGTRPEAFSTVHGSALDSASRPLTNAIVRLRDARFGRIVSTQRTDQAGLFAFRPVDPGIYVVEIVAEDEVSVLAAGDVLSVEAGQTLPTVVKLPFTASALARLLGSSPGAAATVVAESALAGILAIQISGTATCDTLR